MAKHQQNDNNADRGRSENLFDYFKLTLVVGIGLLGSIFAFSFAAGLLTQNSQKQFESVVDNLHSSVETKTNSLLLQYEVVASFLSDSGNLEKSLTEGVKKSLSDAGFSCFLVSHGQPESYAHVNFETIFLSSNIDSSTGKTRFCPREMAFDKFSSLLSAGRRLSRIETTIETDRYGGRYLFLMTYNKKFSLMTVISLSELVPLSNNPLIDVHYGEFFTAKSNPLFIKKSLASLNDTTILTYTPVDGEFTPNLGWAWFVFLCGLVVSIMFATFLFSLIEKNMAVHLEVQKKTADLQRLTKQALLANKTKSRFLANVSHEVRTPLNLILGMAELLQETVLNFEQRNYVNTFRKASSHLLGIIEDILDVARIEAGEVNYHETSVNLVELVEGVSDFVVSVCRTKKISYDCRISPHVPKLVNADPKRLRQILINLINNALKFTDKGGICVSLDVVPQTNDNKIHVVFRISDTGVGIPTEDLERIFEEFYQVDFNNKKNTGGVGLGLSIVKTYVRYLGGKISVESSLGSGSVFSIEIPFTSSDKVSWLDQMRSHRPELEGKRLLVVSPNSIQSEFIRDSMQYFGCKTTLIESGHSAIKIISESGSSYDHYIIDLVGHDVGGLDVLKILIEHNENKEKMILLCPLVHRAKDKIQLADMGISNVCYSPIKIKSLVEALVSPNSRMLDTQRVLAAAMPPLCKGLRVLVAEDDRENRFLIQAYLSNQDVEIQFAENGEVALEHYKNPNCHFDLLITDIQMPKMDGIKLIQEVRGYESQSSMSPIPIVTLTADAQPEQMENIKKIGGNEYVTKPISKKDLICTIAKYETRRIVH